LFFVVLSRNIEVFRHWNLFRRSFAGSWSFF